MSTFTLVVEKTGAELLREVYARLDRHTELWAEADARGDRRTAAIHRQFIDDLNKAVVYVAAAMKTP